MWVLSGAAELCLLSLLLLGAGWAIVEPLAGVCFCASSCVFRGVSCLRLPLGDYATFLAPVACSAPAVVLCLLGLRCLWCGAWFSTLCRAVPPGPAVLRSLPCRRLPFGVSAFSETVCLTYCCAGGVGWAATLPLCSQCFSCAGWLAGVRWVLHPVSGRSHRGCDYSLGASVVVPYGSPCLYGFVSCSVVSSCGSRPLRGLCSVQFLVSLALGWVPFWPAVSTVPVGCEVCSLGCPSWLVLLLMSLFVLHLLLRWGGLVTGLWPLLLLLCGGLLWGLCCAVLSPWALARPTLLGLRLKIPMV